MRNGLVVLALAAASFALPASAGPLEDEFFGMDTNSNGSVSRAEFMASQTEAGLSESSANVAFNKFSGADDRISLSEYRAGPSDRVQRKVLDARPVPVPPARRAPPPRRQPVRRGGGSRGGGS